MPVIRVPGILEVNPVRAGVSGVVGEVVHCNFGLPGVQVSCDVAVGFEETIRHYFDFITPDPFIHYIGWDEALIVTEHVGDVTYQVSTAGEPGGDNNATGITQTRILKNASAIPGNLLDLIRTTCHGGGGPLHMLFTTAIASTDGLHTFVAHTQVSEIVCLIGVVSDDCIHPPPPPPPGGGGPGTATGVTLAHGDPAGYWIGWTGADDGKLRVIPSWHSDQNFRSFVVVDANGDCAEPHLAYNVDRGMLSIIYARGSDMSGWNIWRQYSFDDGATWLYDPDSSTPFLTGVKHGRELFNRRTGERIFLYNDASGSMGSGLIQAAIFRRDGSFIGTFPAGGGGIGGAAADNGSFGALFVEDNISSIEVVFSAGAWRSYDDGRTWVEWI